VSLSYYFDQHMPGPLAHGLRIRGVSVLVAEDDDNKELKDELLLERATALGRILVSNDKDFRRIAARWQSLGRPFAGVVAITDQHASYGLLIEHLLMIAEVYSPDDVTNRIEYIPY